MIDVSEIVVDPDFVQAFTYIRRQLEWVNGRETSTETTFQGEGTIIPETTKDMDLREGGALITGTIRIWTHEKLYTTTDEGYLADLVVYKGQRYIIHADRDLQEYGYNRYIGVRESAS